MGCPKQLIRMVTNKLVWHLFFKIRQVIAINTVSSCSSELAHALNG